LKAEFLPFASEMEAGFQRSVAMEGGIYQRVRRNLRRCALIDRRRRLFFLLLLLLLHLLLLRRQVVAPVVAIETGASVLIADLAIFSLRMVFVVPNARSARLVDIATTRSARVCATSARSVAMGESEVRLLADLVHLGGRLPDLVAQV
jgi:hypothetical protein